MSLYQKYKALPQRTRLLVGGGIIAYATFGLLMTDKAEKALGMEPTKESKEQLRKAVPKIRTVEKGEIERG